jgi:hypothetical protein
VFTSKYTKVEVVTSRKLGGSSSSGGSGGHGSNTCIKVVVTGAKLEMRVEWRPKDNANYPLTFLTDTSTATGTEKQQRDMLHEGMSLSSVNGEDMKHLSYDIVKEKLKQPTRPLTLLWYDKKAEDRIAELEQSLFKSVENML